MSKQKVEKTHSPYSPSSADRWTNCHACINFCKDLPKLPSSRDADEGTEAHDVLETLLKNRLAGSRGQDLRKLVPFLKRQHPEEMVDHCLSVFDYIINELWKDRPGVELMAEQEVDISHFTRPGEKGTLDVAIVEEFGELIIADFKYGAGLFVEAEENRQLLCYALALAKRYNYNFHTIRIIIFQPRIEDEHGNTIREWVIDLDKLLEREEFFKEAFKKTTKKNAKFAFGDWCRYCPGTATCPEVRAKAVEDAQIAFCDEKGLEAVPEPSTLPVKQLSLYLSAAERLEAWIKAVRSHAYAAMERGHKVEGFKLVHKEARRKWSKPEEAHKEAQKKFGHAAFQPMKLLSPAQAETELAKHYDRKEVKQWVKDRVSAVSSGLTIVSENDPREAFDPTSVFDEADKADNKKKKGKKK